MKDRFLNLIDGILYFLCGILLIAVAVAIPIPIPENPSADGSDGRNMDTGPVPEAETTVLELPNDLPHEELPEMEETDKPPCNARYAGIAMSEDERRELAGIVYLESATQGLEGQQAVAEVVLNRVLSPYFPDTVRDVLHEGEGTGNPQFSTIIILDTALPSEAQYEAVDAAVNGPNILPEDVVFFSREGENERVWGKIEDHVFCYAYIWE